MVIPNLPCTGPAPCTLPVGTSFTVPPFSFRAGDRLWLCDRQANGNDVLCDTDAQCQDTIGNGGTGNPASVCVKDPIAPGIIRFAITLTCDEIDGMDNPQSFALSMDLDILFNPADQTTWGEDFEGSVGASLASGGTKFKADNNDAGIPGNNLAQGLSNGDGYRCQYSDPDWPNSNSVGSRFETNCFPAFTLAQSNQIFWQIDGQNITENQVDDGRAKQGHCKNQNYG